VFGLLGPNGAGKTTTIRLLTGLARPTAGSVTVAGLDAGGGTAAQAELHRRVGVLDQEPRFYGWMTGRELLTFVGRLLGLAGSELRTRVGETLDRVGLTDAANRRIGGYSSGMRQRLGIGQAIIGRPSLLILDEPVSSLDPEGRRDLLELIAGLRQASTVILSSHVLSDVERVCERVAILDHGRLVIESAVDDLLERFAPPAYRVEVDPGQQAAVAVFGATLAAEPWVGRVEPGATAIRILVTDPSAAAAALVPALAASGLRVASFERVRPSLEDVFLELVGRDAAANSPAQPSSGPSRHNASERPS
ncbi:MAG TPA: ABC transporter ATP-binding protein, partial [Candidatus Binatus sp.]|nr:ABC transporter ATP-binding protein [Candidatus Binatus sp.]